MHIESVFWAIGLSLFVGALGVPIPENPLLMGGGYALFKNICPPLPSLVFWYLAIVLGDIVLFALSYWFFTRPPLASFLTRYVGPKQLDAYKSAFAARGALTLFLARFTFAIRAVAYIAAGAAHYPWRRFLMVDAVSVAVQVALFVGVGYSAGEHIEWALATEEKLVVVLGLLAALSLVVAWVSGLFIRRLSGRKTP